MNVQTKQTETGIDESLFQEKLFHFISTYVLTSISKTTNLRLAYQMLYNNGNIIEKLNSLHNEDLSKQAAQQLQKLLNAFPKHLFQNFEHIEGFNHSIDTAIYHELPRPAQYHKDYKKLIGPAPDLSRSIYTIYFEQHLQQEPHFKLQLERLYNIIKGVIYRVKFGVATAYNNIGPLDHRVLPRACAQEVQFKHRLLIQDNQQFPYIKLVCSGLSLVLVLMADLFTAMFQLAATINVKQFINDIDNHVPIIFNTYAKLNQESQHKAYQETQQVLEKLHSFFCNGHLQQLPTLSKL